MSVFKTLFFRSQNHHHHSLLRPFSRFSLSATTRPSKPLCFPSIAGDRGEAERASRRDSEGDSRANNLVEHGEKRIEETRTEIPKDLKLLFRRLYKGGYLDDAVFLTNNSGGGDYDDDGLDFSCFDNGFACGFIGFAAEKFGKDNQQIAKLLSGNDMKREWRSSDVLRLQERVFLRRKGSESFLKSKKTP